ncbi:hypothetical protein [Actinomadura madurae]|uniref:hypothetical protein n=1 Tax=Actinomadura madurae TaxID=1993 RepID=UPI0020D20F93|nr:hypothetical protein [Actinomadura madurae]MCP9947352.1 hypothetical protein [Actinomadura madurae]MCP9964118.1 hypothetical protein [Actinomadura madurae]MCP9976590.1 hypothetical protein [Actinomadura madurae]MCQ0011913.1 hypothetical protein [Actinomadura madurae]MCQ0012787.1 hypothetical protein [Actinomadura madurae]
MGEDDQTTKPRQFRVPDGAWESYDAVCKRLGKTRAADLNAHIRRMIKRHGTPEEIARLGEADAEVEARRTRKYSGLRSQRSQQAEPGTNDG